LKVLFSAACLWQRVNEIISVNADRGWRLTSVHVFTSGFPLCSCGRANHALTDSTLKRH
jgi:hypothetical protein